MMYAQGAGLSRTGRERRNNEDTFLVDNDLELYIVADGMGGHSRGELASALAIGAVARSIAEQQPILDAARQGKELSRELPRVAEKAIQEACRAVYREAAASQDKAGMGTTLTMVAVAGRQAVLGHVGDSRLYLHRAGKVVQVSSDHTMAAELVKRGAFDRETAGASPFANVLTRSVGPQPSVEVETLAFEVFPGDTLLLCSDGLCEVLPEADELGRHLAKNVDAIPDALLEVAARADGTDDITVVAVRVASDDEEDARTEEAREQHKVRLRGLRSCPVFEGLSHSRLLRVLTICRVEQLERGGWITTVGKTCEYMGIVLKGTVDVIRGEDHIGELTKGDSFGIDGLLAPRPWRSDLHVSAPTELLVIEREDLAALLTGRPWLGVELARRLGQHAAATTERLWALVDSPPSRPKNALVVTDYC